MPKKESRAVHWCFTINNPEYCLDTYLEELVADGTIKYAVAQLENGKKGVDHYQGYVEFSSQLWFRTVKKLFPTAHIEVARDVDASRDYCKKLKSRVEPPIEVGTFVPPADKRTLWARIEADVANGMLDFDLMKKYPDQYANKYAGIQRLRRGNGIGVRKNKTPVYLIVGPSDIGKTHWCYEKFPKLYKKAISMEKWYDEYDGIAPLLFDDFHGTEMRLKEWLQVTDRYPHQVQVKSSSINFAPECIMITANSWPHLWWEEAWKKQEDKWAVYRRIDYLVKWSRVSGFWVISQKDTMALVEGSEVDKRNNWMWNCGYPNVSPSEGIATHVGELVSSNIPVDE